MSARGGPDLPFTPGEIRGKIHDIVDAPYPAMGPVLEEVLALEASRLASGWRACVAEMTGT